MSLGRQNPANVKMLNKTLFPLPRLYVTCSAFSSCMHHVGRERGQRKIDKNCAHGVGQIEPILYII
jgi:hypothetical protein